MKNLKKVGAVALAAVMAVTFAPVASLNALATPLSGSVALAAANAKIDSDFTSGKGTLFHLVDGAVPASLTVESSCTIDLNGQTLADLQIKKGATVTLIDRTAKFDIDGNVTDAPAGKVTAAKIGHAGTDTHATADKDDTESGTLVVSGAIVSTATLIKGSVDVKEGTVTTLKNQAVNLLDDGSTTNNDTKDVEALQNSSSITIEGGTVSTITLDGAATTNIITGKTSLKKNGGITVTGGTVTLPTYNASAGQYEFPAGQNGNLVNIKGGTFLTGTTAKVAELNTGAVTSAYLNTESEKSLPVAICDSATILVGNDAIKAALNASTGKVVDVINGDANVSGIKASARATIANNTTLTNKKNTLKGTLPTVKAVAEDKVSTLKINEETRTGDNVAPTKTTYWFGQAAIITAVDSYTKPTATEYRVAFDVTYAADFDGLDKKAGTDDDPKFDLDTNNKTWDNGNNGYNYVTDLVYFTSDPSAHVTDGTEVGVLDGKYYVAGADEAIYGNATKSVKILKAKDWEAATKDTTENHDAASAFYVRKGVVANVSGPEDTSVVIYNPTIKHVNLNGSSTDKPTGCVYVFGKDATNGVSDNTDIDGTSGTNGVDANVSAAEIIVKSIINDKLVLTGIDDDITIDAASGLDWFAYGKSGTPHDEYTYEFAKTEKANKDFTNALFGYTSDEDVHHDPVIGNNATDSDVRVSQGISGTYEDLDTSIKIDAEFAGGEQSSTLKADKSARTWYVNLENKNLPRQVYRLRAKVGNNHLFTMDKDEADAAVASGNWVLETTNAFKMLPWNTDVKGAVKVLRFRNVRTNEFLYTTDPKEQADLFASADWAEGNVAFCGVSTETGYPVTRLNSLIGQGHLYSTAKAEVANAVKNDFYKQEGTAFWAVETPEKEK